MSAVLLAVGIFAAVAAGSWLATRIALAWLEQRAILDRPNERSSHSRPTPRGGGIAVMAVLFVGGAALTLLRPDAGAEPWIVLGGMALLALLSWLDDLMDLSAALRLCAHILVVTAALIGLPADAPYTILMVARTAGWLAHALEQRASGQAIKPKEEGEDEEAA